MLIEQRVEEPLLRCPDHGHILGTTARYYEGESGTELVEQSVVDLARKPAFLGGDRCCVVYGYGSVARRVYKRLEREVPGILVLYDAPCVPLVLLPLALVARAHSGLIRIVNPGAAAVVFSSLTNLAMAELYSFRVSLLPSVLEHVRRKRWRANPGRVIGDDPTYFCLGTDGDNPDSKTGSYTWCSHGSECPMDFIEALEPYIIRQGK